MIEEHRITIQRTARYSTLGPTNGTIRQVWFVCHGYGQLASGFLRNFEPLDDGSRLIVAPEGLFRFYLESANTGQHADLVGASWMTREDRETEIRDYLSYPDALHDRVFSQVDRSSARLFVLGFSQGAATAARWVARNGSRARADELILWGGLLPPDVDPDADPPPFRDVRVTLVAGTADKYLDQGVIPELRTRLASRGIASRRASFDGGHRLDRKVLEELAASQHPAS